ncbi:beta-lactamase/transpeptidase-like protein [Bombardia bombarda]|uniref:Beta-lactamase/transpeptidase-like protein n=1 Tax=Bombardia bombarda TaxID=252184 RepID=A0AA40C9R9_9PEZI|nr:beta-lactamase/transpeptidase-like protein [Bombardia bombarda]
MAEILDRILSKYAAQGNDTKDKLLGAAFVVVSKDGILYQGAAGRIGSPTDSPPFAPDSFTWVASLTKIITTTCLMQVVERGLISLDDDVRPLVPELARMQILRGFGADDGQPILEDNKKAITLRHLLTHTVGLAYDIVDSDLVRWSHAVGRTVNNLSYTLGGWNTPLKFAPGEGWCYGSAVDWAGKVLEKLTGQGLEAYMAENIFGLLGINDTTFHSTTAAVEASRVVPCSIRDAASGTVWPCELPVPADPPVESGGAGLWTTAIDHARVLQALLFASSSTGDEADQAGRVLGKKTVDEMFRPQLDAVQRTRLKELTDMFHDGMVPEFPVGFGPIDHGISGIINMEDVPGKRKKGSMMWAGMCNSHWWIDRETGIGATLIVNVLPHPDLVVNRLYDELEAAVYGELIPVWAKKN